MPARDLTDQVAPQTKTDNAGQALASAASFSEQMSQIARGNASAKLDSQNLASKGVIPDLELQNENLAAHSLTSTASSEKLSAKLSITHHLQIADDSHAAPSPSAAQAADKQPVLPKVEVIHDGQNTYTETDWTQGPQEGQKERVFPDKTTILFKPDGKGGEYVDRTNADGTHDTDHARPDGKNGAIVEHVDHNHEESYTAHFNKDGSMKVDWANGQHLEQSVGKDGGTHITSSGSDSDYNFTATEKTDGARQITYSDGSAFVDDGKGHSTFQAAPGIVGSLKQALIMSANSDPRLASSVIEEANTMADSQAASDVMAANP